MQRTRRTLRDVAVITATTAPLLLALASPAAAEPHTATLTVGPVNLPAVVPVEACIDDLCVSTPEATDVTLRVVATTLTEGQPLELTSVPCPSGHGAAVTVSTSVTATVTIEALVTGNGPLGPISVPVGPRIQTIGADTPGVTVLSCSS
ncbi:hypothetical protein [Allostreptomyces psammosilenae]|uniref:Putative caspase-like protein n=1 Tax=Allostreptomyces psammosilenae TaxID=1892865 RepID=A0A852ZTZ5_9ACTN|nr:hypothetical protein [Allostreptomyces psammosilenae]NYI05345.1 putative caspase-like protein [Allostreptomyces psammosilenae]